MSEWSGWEKNFRNILAQLISENVSTTFYYSEELFSYSDEPGSEGYFTNNEHPFWDDYPSWKFMGNIFANAFVRYLNSHHSKRDEYYNNLLSDINTAVDYELAGIFPELDFNLISILSCEKYESSSANKLCATIIAVELDLQFIPDFIPFSDIDCAELKFENTHGLRKLLNMSSVPSSCLVIMRNDKGYRAVGLANRKFCLHTFPCIMFTGHAEWSLHLPLPEESVDDKSLRSISPTTADTTCCDGSIIRYRAGGYCLPKVKTRKGREATIRKALRRLPQAHLAMSMGNIVTLVDYATSQSKGTTIIIGNAGFIRRECKRLCINAKTGIKLLRPVNLLDDKGQTLRELSSIDGALLVDLCGNCYACGVILDSRASIGDMSRGARYNSAKNYLLSQRYNALCHSVLVSIVASEDGMVNILYR